MPLVELLDTKDQARVAVIKSLLEAEGIPFFIENEAFTAVQPLVGSLRVMVSEEHLETARTLISSIDN